MAITIEEVKILENDYHECVFGHGSVEEIADFHLHTNPQIIIPHDQDYSLEMLHELMKTMHNQVHVWLDPWDLVQLNGEPERALATGAVYWEARSVKTGALAKAVVGERWVLQRSPNGIVKFGLYENPVHYFLPDSEPLEL